MSVVVEMMPRDVASEQSVAGKCDSRIRLFSGLSSYQFKQPFNPRHPAIHCKDSRI